MSANTETHAAGLLSDPSPKRKPGRPKGSKDKRPRKNARRTAQRSARARSADPARPRASDGNPQIGSRWPPEASARLDRYAEALGQTRGEALREAALSWIDRWERLSRQEPPQNPAALGFWARVRLAWSVLRGKYSAAQRGSGWVLREGSNTD